MIYLNNFLPVLIGKVFEHLVLYTLGYGLISAIGIRLKKFTKKEIKILIYIFSILLFTLMVKNSFALTNIAKYPPTMYYISYALVSSLIMYLALENNKVFKIFNRT